MALQNKTIAKTAFKKEILNLKLLNTYLLFHLKIIVDNSITNRFAKIKNLLARCIRFISFVIQI